MILAHASDAWLIPSLKSGLAYEIIRLLSGIPARLFLLLVGVSAAIQFEAGIRKGQSSKEMRHNLVKRGLQIVALAYLFRLQGWVLSGFYGTWEILFRVDILNAIGASMLVVAFIGTPRQGKRQVLLPILAAGIFLGLGTTIGPAVFPSYLPRPLTSYLGGQRPMAWFTLFPWGAWSLIGVPIGYLWVWAHQEKSRVVRCFTGSMVIGLSFIVAVHLIRSLAPHIIHYPSRVVEQMGPGIFFHRLGLIGVFAGIGFFWCRLLGPRFSAMRQFGRTSLLIYWIHIELCYGSLVYPIRENLTLVPMLVLVALLTTLMLGVSLLRTHTLPTVSTWIQGWKQKSSTSS
jgi:uncharacterized membrane protein